MKQLPLRFKSSFHSAFGEAQGGDSAKHVLPLGLEPCQVVPVGGAGGAREAQENTKVGKLQVPGPPHVAGNCTAGVLGLFCTSSSSRFW